jgi:hypothetical protein
MDSLTLIVVAKMTSNLQGAFISKLAGFGAEFTNVPFYFKVNANSVLEFRRANGAAYRGWIGSGVDHGNYQFYAVTTGPLMQTTPEFWINKTKTIGAAGVGAATGTPTGNAGFFRVGSADGALSAQSIYSYVSVYNRVLTDAELGSVFDYMETLLQARGETLKGFGSHLMASNIIPAPQVVSASNGTAWLGFDGSTQISNTWVSTAPASQWLQIDLGATKPAKVLGSYRLKMYDAVGTQAPRDWVVAGSNDAVAWTTLDTVTGQTGWVGGQMRSFAVDTLAGPFRYFRITVSANNGHATQHDIGEWYLDENISATATAGGYADHWLPMLGFGQ